MSSNAGYILKERLYVSASTVVVRARRRDDDSPVVIKKPSGPTVSDDELAGLRREYEILRSLDIPEVAQAVAFEMVDGELSLIVEDGGQPICASARRTPDEVADFLRDAIAICASVQAVHERGVIHKDLKPQHLLRSTDGKVKVIDFGLSTRLVQEYCQWVDADSIEGTLAYIAPEQTGRLSRAVDRRSDLYSLGVTLYELATGQLPFRSTDPLEIVHCHLAKAAPRADVICPTIPAMVASIIEKLMAKDAEDRYQSAAGVASDLRRCLADWNESRSIPSFRLATDDVNDVLMIPQRLYGREPALEDLRDCLDRARQGIPQLVLISGPSGVGKSALFGQLRRQLVGREAFVSGTFDPMNRNVPYSAVALACRELVRSVLAAPAEDFAAKKSALLTRLGGNASLMTELVPELELVVGKQPLAPSLGPAESQNRFEQTFEIFLSTLVSNGEPLVVCLDDLHWADPGSLRLMRIMLTSQKGKSPILVVGSYRECEVFEAHPLRSELRKIRECNTEVREIALPSLQPDDVLAWVADALSRPAPEVQQLAHVLHRKTHGNPFELGQYLIALHGQALLYVDKARHRWEWDLEAIGNLDVMDDVAEIILQRLRALPREAQQIAGLGACMGQEFDLSVVAAASDLSPEALRSGVQAALREEVLIPLARKTSRRIADGVESKKPQRDFYRFSHERIREAAYQLIAKEQRPALHCRIGRLLRAGAGDNPTDDRLFAVVRQLNLGSDCLDAAERRSVAELNLQCARKARSTAAAAQASEYAEQTLHLLGEGAWASDYAMAFQAQIGRVESEYLRGQNERMLAILDDIDANARTNLDQAASRNLRTIALMRMVRLADARENGVAALRLLGIEVPESNEKDEIERAIAVEFAAATRELAAVSLADLPEMDDPLAVAQVEALARAIPPAYLSLPRLMVLLVLKATRLLVRHGSCDLTPFFLAQYAIAHLAMTGDHRAAHRLGKLAVDLGLRRHGRASLGSAYFLFGGFTGHWCEPFRQSIEALETGLERCLGEGDLLHAVHCQAFAIAERRMAGIPLSEIRALLPDAVAMAVRYGDSLNRRHLVLQERLLAALQGEAESPGSLDGDGFSESACEAELPDARLCWLRAAQAIVRFHAGQYRGVLAATSASKVNIGLPVVIDLRLYEGLAHAALARLCDGDERRSHLDALSRCMAEFDIWASLCPDNHEHRRAMLAASVAELGGNLALAMEEYEKAIATAQSSRCLENHALACELCGDFHLRAGRTRIARLYLADAVGAYRAWGAMGKVSDLLRRFPDLESSDESGGGRVPGLTVGLTSKRRPSSATGGGLAALDFESAMRASQAIARELFADRLVDRLLEILVENAGAQRGVLVVPKDNDWAVAAEWTIDPGEVGSHLHKGLAEALVPEKLVRLVARTHETLVWNDVPERSVVTSPLGSALGLPLLHQGQLSAVVYLENRAVAQGFNTARLSRLQFLATQAAAALENSRLYEQLRAAKQDLELRVQERTQELLQRNGDLRNVLDTVNQGLVTVDRSGRLLGESSARAKTWFGPLAEGMLWLDVLTAADPFYAQEFSTFFARLVKGEAIPAELGQQVRRKLTLAACTLEIELRPVGGDAAWEQLLVVASDVTDRERQARLEMDLRQAQKLQAVGELAAGIAHEINTPAQFVGDSVDFLTGAFAQTLELVRGYRKAVERIADARLVAEMQSAEEAADIQYTEENAPAALERAREGVTRIATIVRAMKEFAHPDHRQKAFADINRAIETTLTIARNEYKYVADVETELSELPLVFCHVGDLNQVFLNLIVNAAHAISDVVGKSGNKGRIVVRTFSEGRNVRIEIADTGCGIPEEIRDRVYDPFFTTKEVGRGSGQGLAIARSIVVDKHDGLLHFESEVGQGTTFIIVLPVSPPEGSETAR